MTKSDSAIWYLFKEKFNKNEIHNNHFILGEMLYFRDYFSDLIQALDKEIERFE